MQNSRDFDRKEHPAEFDDMPSHCKQRVVEVLSGMSVTDVRKLVGDIEEKPKRDGKR